MTKPAGRTALALLLFVTCVLSPGCGDKATAGGLAAALGRTSLGNPEAGGPLTDAASALAADHRAGAAALYRALVSGQDNMVLSPLALQLALGMAYIGSSGQTSEQLAAAMGWRQAPPQFAAAQATLLNGLARAQQTLASELVEGAEGEAQPPLSTATRAFVGQHRQLSAAYGELLRSTYNLSVGQLDFSGAPEPSRLAINLWASEQTAGKIADLLPAGSITPDTLLVLTAALRFAAHWQVPMLRDMEPALAFRGASGQVKALPGLRITDSFAYAQAQEATSVRLPYRGGYSMLLIKPAGDLEQFEASLDANSIDRWAALDHGQAEPVAVTMPAFEIDSSAGDLVGVLKQMGVVNLFEAKHELAMFADAADNAGLLVTGVYEKAHILLDEQGTQAEAAAAVVVGMEASAAQPPAQPPKQFTLDRPFLYLLQDDYSGSIVFMGRFVAP